MALPSTTTYQDWYNFGFAQGWIVARPTVVAPVQPAPEGDFGDADWGEVIYG